MKLRYNFRLDPNPLQEHNMRQSAGNARWLWNFFLSENIREYNQTKKFIFYNEMAGILTELKQYNEWLKLSYSQVLQQTLKDLDNALKFKKTGRGFPKFKCKWNSNDSFRYVQNTKIIGDKLRLPKIGDVKIKLHRDLPPHSSVTIYREVDKWYASFVVEVAEQVQIPKDQIDSVIGIDVNANNIADSNGHLDQNPRCNRKYKKKLKRLQQSVSRKEKKSKNRAKAILRLKKFNVKLKNIKMDFLHKLSNRIAKEAKLVCAETLDIEKMKKNHLSAIAIQDNGWASLFGLLEYKCQLSGHHFHQINQYFPSSQTCFCCGNRKR